MRRLHLPTPVLSLTAPWEVSCVCCCPDSTSSCPGKRTCQSWPASPPLLLRDEGKYLAAGQHDASFSFRTSKKTWQLRVGDSPATSWFSVSKFSWLSNTPTDRVWEAATLTTLIVQSGSDSPLCDSRDDHQDEVEGTDDDDEDAKYADAERDAGVVRLLSRVVLAAS